jgi:hypothetical protein
MGLTANELFPSKGTGGSNPLASAQFSADTIEDKAPVAQRIEHLTTDQKVRGSNPFGRTPQALAALANALGNPGR